MRLVLAAIVFTLLAAAVGPSPGCKVDSLCIATDPGDCPTEVYPDNSGQEASGRTNQPEGPIGHVRD